MAIIDIFSKRQKRSRGEIPDVYQYEDFPKNFRVQVIHIWHEAIGNHEEFQRYGTVQQAYKAVVDILRKEYGVFKLVNNAYANFIQELESFFLQEEDPERVIDVIELSYRVIDHLTRGWDYKNENEFDKKADEGIADLNSRFKEHGIGYQLEEGEIIRVDSQLMHAEVIKPALQLLNGKVYLGAQQEFLNAYEHYRHGRAKEALNDALKAFESTMKAICDKRGWGYNKADTSKNLIEICYQNQLVPTFWQQQMSGLRALLEGGVPTGRNKLSGHGQGSTPTAVPDHIVSYMLHMTGAAIIFLIKSEQNIK